MFVPRPTKKHDLGARTFLIKSPGAIIRKVQFSKLIINIFFKKPSIKLGNDPKLKNVVLLFFLRIRYIDLKPNLFGCTFL